jgi:WD40 repeat protein
VPIGELPASESDAPLPRGAVARLGTTRFRQGEKIVDMAFLPDGRIATAGRDLRVLILDPTSGLPTNELKGPRWVAESVAISPDGSLVAGGDRDEIFIWKLPSGELVHRIKGGFNYARSMSFSPDGKLLAAAADDELSGDGDETVCLYDVTLGKRIHAFTGHKRWGHTIAFSPDGKRLASGDEHGTLYLWDIASRREIAKLEGHERRVDSVAFSPDGRTLVSAGGSPSLLRWDALTGKSMGTLRERGGGEQIAFSSDGRSLFVGGRSHLEIVDPATAEGSTRLFEKPFGSPFALSRDGKVIAVTEDEQAVSLWQVAGKKRLSPEPDGPRAAIEGVSFSASGDKVTVLSEKWELATYTVKRGKLDTMSTVPEHTGLSSRAATCAWPEESSFENRVYRVACSADGSVIAGSRSGALVVRGGPTPLEIKLDKHETPDCMSFSPDEKRLAVGTSDGNLLVVDLATGKVAVKVEATRWGVDTCPWSPDGKSVVTSAGWDDPLTFWDASTGKKVKDLGLFKYPIEAAAFSPDGRSLAVSFSRGIGRRVIEGESWVRVFDVASGKVVSSFDGHPSSVFALAFSPDGRILATGSQDATVLLWDVQNLPKP